MLSRRDLLFRHLAGKPLLLEEFGFPRDGGSLNPNATTTGRDMMYAAIFKARAFTALLLFLRSRELLLQ